MTHFDDAIRSILDLYIGLSCKPPHNQHTVLAAFFLSSPKICKVVSVATGTKCLPTAKFPERGEALHDCHAEIVARRAALRWFLEEIVRYHGPQQSQWICRNHENGKHHLRTGIQLNLYVSTLPCGDASTRYLAATQDEGMAQLKDSSPQPNLLSSVTNDVSSGRDGYSRLGVLRTKPGRADSPPTICMSCSDKIAAWNVHGIQGALGSFVLEPLYISAVVIGGVPNDDIRLHQMIWEDCERALWARVANVKGLPQGYDVHKPAVHFTTLPFIHSQSELIKTAPGTNTTNESLCWIADRKTHEILINGLKRGVSPKHRFRDKSRPLLCKRSMYQSLRDTLVHLSLRPPDSLTTYVGFKQTAQQYQNAKEALRGPKGPFSAWIKSGSPWESFCLEVTVHAST